MTGPGDMKLPELEQRYMRGYYRPIEWVVDPAILRRLRDEVLQEIAVIELETQARIAELEAAKIGAIAKAIKSGRPG